MLRSLQGKSMSEMGKIWKISERKENGSYREEENIVENSEIRGGKEKEKEKEKREKRKKKKKKKKKWTNPNSCGRQNLFLLGNQR